MSFEYHCKECGNIGYKVRLGEGDPVCGECGSLDIIGQDRCAELGCEDCIYDRQTADDVARARAVIARKVSGQ
jgi:hypothetical protein